MPDFLGSPPTALTKPALPPRPLPRPQTVLPTAHGGPLVLLVLPLLSPGACLLSCGYKQHIAQVDPRPQRLPKIQVGMSTASWTSPLRHCVNIPDGNPKRILDWLPQTCFLFSVNDTILFPDGDLNRKPGTQLYFHTPSTTAISTPWLSTQLPK